MLIKKGQMPILATNIISILIFSFFFLSRKNYEFLMYIGVIIFFLFVILLTNKKVNYPSEVLWGLTLWSILHMSGGSIRVNGMVLYNLMLINLVGEPYNILRYDQFVHIIGFGAATLAMYYLLRPLLKQKIKKWTSLSIIVIMAGLGIGALNEIVEFVAVIIVAQTGVGGYLNTALDLVSDLIGAVIATIYIVTKEKKT